ncbi:endonuclease/exonuclease/phosphatase family protein [uncultured Pseudokineococcus sp.]|uniref:endonuclease/exonuclease/phosphatase family protein n=1 Tax=uncultured Pseudokineococcus sp. TaxID=1642928 RepID=UPI00263437CB|nr:endonuclease/exonuclease/phosphatase family protein [uncultured Pseudokineococcus sp.]
MSAAVRGGPGTLRVLTWNVHGLRAGAPAVGDVLREARCDVALLQEAPRGLRSVPRAAALARRSGLLVAAAGRPAAGALVLVAARLHVSAAAVEALPVRGLTTPIRGSARAVVSAPGGRRVLVAAAHLGLGEDERADHVARLAAAPGDRDEQGARGDGGPPDPVVVGADLNEHPGGASWVGLLPGGRDAWAVAGSGAGATFPADSPRARIDGLLVRGLDVVSTQVLDVGRASDHRALLAELAVPGL